jgi:hypothetical protein
MWVASENFWLPSLTTTVVQLCVRENRFPSLWDQLYNTITAEKLADTSIVQSLPYQISIAFPHLSSFSFFQFFFQQVATRAPWDGVVM